MNPAAGVERPQYGFDFEGVVAADQVDLVEHDEVGELDLIDQQIGNRALVLFAQRLTAVPQLLGGVVILQKTRGVHDGDHRVEARDVAQAHTVLVLEGERLSDGDRLRDPRGFDEQIVEAPLLGQPGYFGEQVIPQRAADAAVRHLDERLFGPRELGTAALNERRVNVDLAHVVHDHRDPGVPRGCGEPR